MYILKFFACWVGIRKNECTVTLAAKCALNVDDEDSIFIVCNKAWLEALIDWLIDWLGKCTVYEYYLINQSINQSLPFGVDSVACEKMFFSIRRTDCDYCFFSFFLVSDGAAIRQRRAKVTYSYEPQHEDELALKVGDELMVSGEDEEGLWLYVLPACGCVWQLQSAFVAVVILREGREVFWLGIHF